MEKRNEQQASIDATNSNELFIRKWHKLLPMKAAHEQLGVYHGTWSSQMDRYWESNDGLTVSSRQIRTAWGIVEHVAISRMNGDKRDLPWAIKQQVKDELFGTRSTAIEVFPSRKRLVDVCDVYHLWVLPKGFELPFGLHPTRDAQGTPINRGYDFSLEESQAWINSDERAQLHETFYDGIMRGLTEALAFARGEISEESIVDEYNMDRIIESNLEAFKRLAE